MGLAVRHSWLRPSVWHLNFGLGFDCGNVILVATGTKPVLAFLGSGLGILITAVIAIVLVFVGVSILWFLKPPISQIEALEADEDNARQSPQYRKRRLQNSNGLGVRLSR